jgi:hypothetical protein
VSTLEKAAAFIRLGFPPDIAARLAEAPDAEVWLRELGAIRAALGRLRRG